jgi:hypothetical protein
VAEAQHELGAAQHFEGARAFADAAASLLTRVRCRGTQDGVAADVYDAEPAALARSAPRGQLTRTRHACAAGAVTRVQTRVTTGEHRAAASLCLTRSVCGRAPQRAGVRCVRAGMRGIVTSRARVQITETEKRTEVQVTCSLPALRQHRRTARPQAAMTKLNINAVTLDSFMAKFNA